jgi:hypothetical protein
MPVYRDTWFGVLLFTGVLGLIFGVIGAVQGDRFSLIILSEAIGILLGLGAYVLYKRENRYWIPCAILAAIFLTPCTIMAIRQQR